MAIKILITNQKGGVGKTTTSIMLAQELSRHGKKTLIVDLDAQMNTTMFYRYGELQGEPADELEGGSDGLTDIKDMGDLFDVSGIYTSLDIFCDDVPASKCVQHLRYGDIIFGDRDLCDAETSIKNDYHRFTHLRNSLSSVDDAYDFIIIDTPPARSVILRNGLAAADEIIIPAVEDGWSLDGLMDLNEDIIGARDTYNHELSIMGILIIRSRPNTNKSKIIAESARKMAKDLGTIVFDSTIRESVKVAEAMSVFCAPLWMYAPNSGPQIDYEFLTDEILDILKHKKRSSGS